MSDLLPYRFGVCYSKVDIPVKMSSCHNGSPSSMALRVTVRLGHGDCQNHAGNQSTTALSLAKAAMHAHHHIIDRTPSTRELFLSMKRGRVRFCGIRQHQRVVMWSALPQNGAHKDKGFQVILSGKHGLTYLKVPRLHFLTEPVQNPQSSA